MVYLRYILAIALVLMGWGCASLTLKPVDFSWKLENVVTIDDYGDATGPPKTLSFNAKELFQMEGIDLSGASGESFSIRMIRDRKGFYYMTAKNFRHVYVFKQKAGALKLKSRILIDKMGMQAPALNQRDPYIQLLTGDKEVMLTHKGISKGN